MDSGEPNGNEVKKTDSLNEIIDVTATTSKIDDMLGQCSADDAKMIIAQLAEKYGEKPASKKVEKKKKEPKPKKKEDGTLETAEEREARELKEKDQKLYEKCVRRYYVYDDRCKRLRCHLEDRDLNRVPYQEMKDRLKVIPMAELEEFLVNLRPAEARVEYLERLHFPDMIFCYPEPDCFSKQMKKFGNCLIFPFRFIWSKIKCC